MLLICGKNLIVCKQLYLLHFDFCVIKHVLHLTYSNRNRCFVFPIKDFLFSPPVLAKVSLSQEQPSPLSVKVAYSTGVPMKLTPTPFFYLEEKLKSSTLKEICILTSILLFYVIYSFYFT